MAKQTSGAAETSAGEETPDTIWEQVPDHLENSKTHRAMVPGGWLVRTTVYIRLKAPLDVAAAMTNPKSMRFSSHATQVSTAIAFVPDPKWSWDLSVTKERAKATRAKR